MPDDDLIPSSDIGSYLMRKKLQEAQMQLAQAPQLQQAPPQQAPGYAGDPGPAQKILGNMAPQNTMAQANPTSVQTPLGQMPQTGITGNAPDAIAQYQQAVQNTPLRSDYHPSRAKNILGTIAGIYSGAQAGSPERGMRVADDVKYSGYNRNLADYNQQLDVKKQLAQMEVSQQNTAEARKVAQAKIDLEDAQRNHAMAQSQTEQAKAKNLEPPEHRQAREEAVARIKKVEPKATYNVDAVNGILMVHHTDGTTTYEQYADPRERNIDPLSEQGQKIRKGIIDYGSGVTEGRENRVHANVVAGEEHMADYRAGLAADKGYDKPPTATELEKAEQDTLQELKNDPDVKPFIKPIGKGGKPTGKLTLERPSDVKKLDAYKTAKNKHQKAIDARIAKTRKTKPPNYEIEVIK